LNKYILESKITCGIIIIEYLKTPTIKKAPMEIMRGEN